MPAHDVYLRERLSLQMAGTAAILNWISLTAAESSRAVRQGYGLHPEAALGSARFQITLRIEVRRRQAYAEHSLTVMADQREGTRLGDQSRTLMTMSAGVADNDGMPHARAPLCWFMSTPAAAS